MRRQKKKILKPPFLAEAMVRRLSWEEDRPSILEDVLEEFDDRILRQGYRRAWLWYWLHALRSVLPSLGFVLKWRYIMLNNYLKIAFRNISRQKAYAAINILGLSIGMAAALFILFWVREECSFDRFHANADRIYRMAQVFHYDDYHLEQANTPSILAETMKNECPEAELVTRVRGFDETLVIAGENRLNEARHGVADDQFFKVFSFPFIQGNPETVLSAPQTAVISESAAKKYFGDSDPIGKSLTFYDQDFQVTGIYRDMPPNSHFHFDILCSITSFPRYLEPSWGYNVFKTYVLLREGGSTDALQDKLNDIVKKYMFRSAEEYEAVLAKGNSTTFPLQSMTEIHLHSHLLWEFEANGNGTYVRFFTIIALFILLIAVFNYINLSTARSTRRALEVGIRKTVGSTRTSLVRQFMVESVSTSLIALVLALVFIQILMPAFRQLVGMPWLGILYMQYPLLFIVLIALTILIGVIAGIYPSLLLSSFKPIAVLSGKVRKGLKSSRFRSGLVVLQFSLSIMLIVCTLVVRKQMGFVQSQSLGFDREQVVVVKTFGQMSEKLSTLKDALLRNPAVVAVSASSSVSGTSFTNLGFRMEGSTSGHGTNLFAVDSDFLDVMKLEMVEGRFFSKEIPSDGHALILNESEVYSLGTDDLLDKRFEIWVGELEEFHVIGIVKDFHYESFHEPVKPLGLIMIPGAYRWGEAYVSVRIRPENVRTTMAFIRQTWEEIVPRMPFEYSFLDTIYNDLYQNEERTGRVFTIFTLFALFVACLGLLGLSSFAAEQRTKEIGIRKVLGANVPGILFMLSKEYLKWIIVASIIASPLAYLVMKKWLQSFAYQTSIGYWIFGLSSVAALVIALVAVSYQSMKVASANPVNALKYE